MSESSQPEKSPQPGSDAEQLELKLPDESAAPKDLGLWAGVLVLLTMIAFWYSTTGSFVWRDDRFAQARWLEAPGGLSLAWFGRWEHPETFNLPVYQPAALTAYWLEYRAGGKTDQNLPAPMAYHVASLIFQAGAAVLLWFLLRELQVAGAWIIAAIFALHPIHAEPVSWISEQSTVLAGMFFVGSIACYLLFIKWRARDAAERASGGEGVDPAQTWGLYAGSVAMFLLAILSEPSAVVLPVVLMLLLWWRNRLTSRDGLLITPMLLVGFALWISTADLHTKATEPILLHEGWLVKAVWLGHGLWASAAQLVLPTGFSVMDFASDSVQPSAGGFYISILTVLVFILVALAVLHWTKQLAGRGPMVALAVFMLLVCSSLNWFDPTRLSPLTDCTAYLAMVPAAALLIAFISRFKLPGPHPQSAVAISTVVLIAFGLVSWMRTHAFENSVALWRDVIGKDPRSAFAQGALAEQLRHVAIDDYASGNLDEMKAARREAIEHASSAMQLDPDDDRPQRTWANVLVESGDAAAAMEHFKAAANLDPHNPQLHTEYAAALVLLGRFQEAIPELDAALREDPSSSTAHRLLGEAYAGLGNTDRAVKEQQFALELNPVDFTARQKLAELQVKAGKPEDLKNAMKNYFYILNDGTQQNRPDIWLAVACIVRQRGDLENALTYLKTAEWLAKDDPEMLKKVEAEMANVQHLAATRPSTRSTTLPATTPAGG